MSAGTIFEFFFSKERHSLFFPILSNFFLSSKNVRQIFETRNLGIRGSFWGRKNKFEIFQILPHFFEVWSKKRLVGKFFPSLSQLQSACPAEFFEEKYFSFWKKLHLIICFGVWAFLLIFRQKKSGYQGNNLLIRKQMDEKVCRKIDFFESFSDSEQKVLKN